MDDSLKYLIHARITADGVVERSDVVGAVFGQTEGLLGDELELRGLQEAAKVGRIDVEVESENGRSFGELTVASNLDKVETAILAAALETIERVGPCVASVEVTRIEDVRAAKRRAVVDRAKELLAEGFDESTLSSAEILEEVRESTRTGQVEDYEGLPAGPNVADGDAVIVVEGRADVRRLLEFGIKNAVAVEGTDVPEAVADVTRGRTATAFLDGDRGGDLILRELAQVGKVDYVARAPRGRSVEDLSRDEVTEALREKRTLDSALAAVGGAADDATSGPDADTGTETGTDTETDPDAGELGADRHPDPPTDADDRTVVPSGDRRERAVADRHRTEAGGETTATDPEDPTSEAARTDGSRPVDPTGDAESGGPAGPDGATPPGPEGEVDPSADPGTDPPADQDQDQDPDPQVGEPTDVPAHAAAVVGEALGLVRLLDADATVLAEGPADEALSLLREQEGPVAAVVVDGVVDQPLADEAAAVGAERVVGRELGSLVKRPAAVRLHTWREVAASERPPGS